jgi:hypothetical protein
MMRMGGCVESELNDLEESLLRLIESDEDVTELCFQDQS